jgi:hypothetical protein
LLSPPSPSAVEGSAVKETGCSSSLSLRVVLTGESTTSLSDDAESLPTLIPNQNENPAEAEALSELSTWIRKCSSVSSSSVPLD